MSNKSKVESFLKELKETMSIWDIYFLDRKKNSLQDLADIGITANRRKEIINNLEVLDYSEGPLEETQNDGKELWVFGKFIKKTEIYIKLTIVRATSRSICISFHKSEYPMKYPLKQN